MQNINIIISIQYDTISQKSAIHNLGDENMQHHEFSLIYRVWRTPVGFKSASLCHVWCRSAPL